MGILHSSPLFLTRLAALVWLALLIYLATLPRQPYVPGVPRESLSTLAHFGTHALLAGLVYLSLGELRSLLWRGLAAGLAFLVSAALGVTLEGLQFIVPDRAAQISDLMASIVGAGAGVAVVFVLDHLKLNRNLMSVGAFSIVLLSLGATASSVVIWDPQLPRVGDHWHAHYSINVCGRTVSPLPATLGNVHTHGDSLVHIHPQTTQEAGTNANLALFFTTSGGGLTNSSLTLPSGETLQNGDRCSDGRTGELSVTVNGQKLVSPSTYVFRDGDRVQIEFLPAGDL